jgi:hypothetical protein
VLNSLSTNTIPNLEIHHNKKENMKSYTFPLNALTTRLLIILFEVNHFPKTLQILRYLPQSTQLIHRPLKPRKLVPNTLQMTRLISQQPSPSHTLRWGENGGPSQFFG